MDVSRIESGSTPTAADNSSPQPPAVVAQRSKLVSAMQAINTANILGATGVWGFSNRTCRPSTDLETP